MKNATLKKLFASTLAVALCVPVLLADPMSISANAASSSSVSGNTISGNTSGSSSSTGSSSGSSASSTVSTTIEANRKITVGGRVVSSTVSGVYIATAIRGVAVTTPAVSVSAAAGLSQADIDSGTNVRFYVCNSTNKEAKDALSSAATAAGKKVAAYVNFDLYTISKKGVVTAVRNSSEPIALTFGLPGHIANAGNNVSIMCIDKDGKTVVMEDTDTEPGTLTVNASVFGVYAIVY